MVSDVVLEGSVEFDIFRRFSNKFRKSGYKKLANLFFILKVFRRRLSIIGSWFLISSGIYRQALHLFGKDGNICELIFKKPIISEITLNLMVDAMIIDELGIFDYFALL